MQVTTSTGVISSVTTSAGVSGLLTDETGSGVAVFGVSRDSIASHEKFKAKMNFPFELLSDADEELCQGLNVIKMKNMYGKQVRGVERSTFVIDRDGSIVREWRGVKVPGHAQEVLDFVRSTRL